MGEVMKGRVIVAGTAVAPVIFSRQAISFWGGIDPSTGRIIDRRHDRCGAFISGKVFAFPEEKGSSTASAVLVELIHNGHAPAAIVTREIAPIIALGSIVADELYGIAVPILTLTAADFDRLLDEAEVRIMKDGKLEQEEGDGGSSS